MHPRSLRDRLDFTAEKIIGELGVNGYSRFDGAFHRQVIRRAADAIRAAMPNARPVTHYGCGEAAVIQVASQRRIQGPDGRIRASRTSSTRDPTIRAEPEGVIDPVVSVLSFWDGASPVAVLSFYACHRIDVTCLRVRDTRMLHLPGELFVEYQLAAKAMRPDLRVMMAAYGDYGPGYIGTAVAYLEGGYETQPTSSNTTPEAEAVLMAAMRGLLGQADRDAE